MKNTTKNGHWNIHFKCSYIFALFGVLLWFGGAFHNNNQKIIKLKKKHHHHQMQWRMNDILCIFKNYKNNTKHCVLVLNIMKYNNFLLLKYGHKNVYFIVWFWKILKCLTKESRRIKEREELVEQSARGTGIGVPLISIMKLFDLSLPLTHSFTQAFWNIYKYRARDMDYYYFTYILIRPPYHVAFRDSSFLFVIWLRLVQVKLLWNYTTIYQLKNIRAAKTLYRLGNKNLFWRLIPCTFWNCMFFPYLCYY